MISILSGIALTLSASPAISLVAKATVVAALGLISAWFARRSRAAVRHALLASTFSVLLALPIVSFLAAPVAISVPVAAGNSDVWPLFDYTSVPSSGEPAYGRFSATPAKSEWALPSLATILLCGWFMGTAIFMIPIVSGLLQIRSLRRFGLPWRHGQAVAEDLAPGARRRAEVLLHESMPGPMTCGVLHPVIILPADAQSWDKQDLERALVHELEHVRRFDWPIHCLARVACAAYWFHPLVWIAWRHLALEAERSCDDAVLRNSEATAYADQLVGLARRRSIVGKSPALAMASRSDLTARVAALLDGSQPRGPVGALLLTAACIAAAAIALTMSPLRMVAAPQSDAPAATPNIPKWDAVSIKPCADTDRPNPTLDSLSSNRMMLNCKPLEGLANVAYNLFVNGKRNLQNVSVTRIEGFPDWARSERYTIEAKAEGSPGQLMMNGLMLRALLEDRFRLKVHKEIREGKVYILSVATGGPKMPTPPPGGCTTLDYDLRDDTALVPPRPPNPCPYSGDRPPLKALDAWMNMDTLTYFLGRPDAGLDAPLFNKTALAGAYHVQLQWSNQALSPATQETDGTFGPSIFTAVQKLGLKIEAGRGPRQFLVFDHAERPSAN